MNELTFLDLVILKKIDSDSSVEKFGSLINTSFFETANLLGTVKIKGYISIESSIGGASKVTLTDAGQSLLSFAEKKTQEPIEPLDSAIIRALASGAKDLVGMQNALNVRSADLAYHINKLIAQGFMDYEVRSATVSFVLTEKGFNSTGGVRVQQNVQGEAAPAANAAPPAESAANPPWVAPHQQPQSSVARPLARPAPVRSQPAAPPRAQPAQQHVPEKEDVAHLISDADLAKHHRHAAEHKKASGKEDEKTRRLVSKIEYYIVEYAPFILLAILVIVIFIAALFLSMEKKI